MCSNPKGVFVITTAGRTKLVLLAGVTLAAVVLALAFAGSSAAAEPTPSATAHSHDGGGVAAAKNGDNGTVGRSTAPRRRWLTGATNHTCVRSTLTPSALTQPSRCPGRSSRGRRPVPHRCRIQRAVTGQQRRWPHRRYGAPERALPKLLWNFQGEKGSAKQKVFWVACGAPTRPPTHHPKPTPSHGPKPSPSGSARPSPSVPPTTPATPTVSPSLAAAAGSSSGPSSPGGLPITGWPLALIAVVGAGLLGTGGAAIVAARRRHGLRAR